MSVARHACAALYNRETHKLYWAKELAFSDSPHVGAVAAKAGFFKVLWVGILAFKKLIVDGLAATPPPTAA